MIHGLSFYVICMSHRFYKMVHFVLHPVYTVCFGTTFPLILLAYTKLHSVLLCSMLNLCIVELPSMLLYLSTLLFKTGLKTSIACHASIVRDVYGCPHQPIGDCGFWELIIVLSISQNRRLRAN